MHVDIDNILFHKIFGHINLKYIQKLSQKGMVTRFPNIHFSIGFFQGCVVGKDIQDNFEKGKDLRASSPLELIHGHIMRPFLHSSISKERCMLTFIDHFSRYTWVYFLRKKSEVLSISKTSNIMQRLNLGGISK
jgi:hypothetical protein